jgi:hypothetical protein
MELHDPIGLFARRIVHTHEVVPTARRILVAAAKRVRIMSAVTRTEEWPSHRAKRRGQLWLSEESSGSLQERLNTDILVMNRAIRIVPL